MFSFPMKNKLDRELMSNDQLIINFIESKQTQFVSILQSESYCLLTQIEKNAQFAVKIDEKANI